MSARPNVPPALKQLVKAAREMGYERPLFETDTGRVRVQLWGNDHGRRNVVAHCNVREVREQLPGFVPVNECAEIAMRSALMKALQLAASDAAAPVA